MVCKKCGGPPTVAGLRDDSVVRHYNLTLECTAQGNPAPTVHWYKDDILLTPSRHVKIRTRKRRRRRISRGRGTRTPRQSPNPFLSEGFGRKRRLRRRRRGGGGVGGGGGFPGAMQQGGGAGGEGGRDLLAGGGGGGGVGVGAAGTGIAKKRRIRGSRRREDGERRRLTGRRRVVGDETEEEGEGGGGGGGGTTAPRRLAEGRRRRLRGRSHGRNGDGATGHRGTGHGHTGGRHSGSRVSSSRSTISTSTTESSSSSSSTASSSSSSSSSSTGGSRRKRPPSDVRRSKAITSTLMVIEVDEGDAGVYKCVAKSVAGEESSQARIRVVPPIDPHPFVDKCPIDGFCLNGGTCMMFKIVGELVCQCAEGFKGQRCEEKEVYPTFRRDCHGPLRHIRHARGLRCPRNQPTALWELLQQALARGQKKSAWTKNHFTNWSPTLTEHMYWPRYMTLAPHSSKVPKHKAHQNGAPVPNKPHPTVDILSPKASSMEVQHIHQTTQDPMLLDSLIPDLNHSQILKWRGHQGSPLSKDSSSLVSQQQSHTNLERNTNPLSTFRTPMERKARHEVPQNVQRNEMMGLSPTQPYNYREDKLVLPTRHHRQKSHRKHHQRHPSRSADPPPSDTQEEIYTTDLTRMARDQRETEVRLPWSSQMANNTPPHYLTTPNQVNLQQQ